MITLSILADRVRKKNMIVTDEEAINVFLLIPEGCQRHKRAFNDLEMDEYISQYFRDNPDKYGFQCNYDQRPIKDVLTVNGLGEFVIK